MSSNLTLYVKNCDKAVYEKAQRYLRFYDGKSLSEYIAGTMYKYVDTIERSEKVRNTELQRIGLSKLKFIIKDNYKNQMD